MKLIIQCHRIVRGLKKGLVSLSQIGITPDSKKKNSDAQADQQMQPKFFFWIPESGFSKLQLIPKGSMELLLISIKQHM